MTDHNEPMSEDTNVGHRVSVRFEDGTLDRVLRRDVSGALFVVVNGQDVVVTPVSIEQGLYDPLGPLPAASEGLEGAGDDLGHEPEPEQAPWPMPQEPVSTQDVVEAVKIRSYSSQQPASTPFSNPLNRGKARKIR